MSQREYLEQRIAELKVAREDLSDRVLAVQRDLSRAIAGDDEVVLQKKLEELLDKRGKIETELTELKRQLDQLELNKNDPDLPSNTSFSAAQIAKLPHPIAVTCNQFNQAETDKERFVILDRLVNNLVKYLTAIALSQYWQDQPDKNQLRVWLSQLSHADLTTSLTVFSHISDHYRAASNKFYFYPALFEPYTTPVDDESAIANTYRLVRRLRGGRHPQEDITPQTFLTRLLALRERNWETDVSQIDLKVQKELLPVLQPALKELISIFSKLFDYPLRYVNRVDLDGQDWIYTTVEFLGPTSEPVLSDPFFREQNIEHPNYPAHRLYLCMPDGQPQLNLHPFLIAHLNKLYFLEQAADKANVWYQHCASAKRYYPPAFYSSIFLSASKTGEEIEEADDPVDQLKQATNQLEEEENKDRVEEMPLSVLLIHLSAEGQQALEIALGEALRIGRFWLGVEFLLMGLTKQEGRPLGDLLHELRLSRSQFRGALRGMVGVVTRDDWHRVDVEALGQQAFSSLKEADPLTVASNYNPANQQSPLVTPRMLAILRKAIQLAGDQKAGHAHLLLGGLLP